MHSRVSVIIAAYNAEATLTSCVVSVAKQKNVIVEIIIIDDCSTDNTLAVAESLQQVYQFIIILRNEQNSGPSFSRNRGIDSASYEWLAVVDADDTILENRLIDMVQYSDAHNLDFCFDNMSIVLKGNVDESTSPLIKEDHKYLLNCVWDIQMYTHLNKPYISPVLIGFLKPLIKKNFIDVNNIRYNEKVKNSEDYLLVLEALIKNAKILFLDKCLYDYVIEKNSLSGKFDNNSHMAFLNEERILLNNYEFAINKINYEAILSHIEAFEIAGRTNLLFQHIKNFNILDAFKIIWLDKKNALLHFQRIIVSLLRKAFHKSNRGK